MDKGPDRAIVEIEEVRVYQAPDDTRQARGDTRAVSDVHVRELPSEELATGESA